MTAFVAASGVYAQSYNQVKSFDGELELIPSEYAVDGKSKIVLSEEELDDGNATQVVIYDDDFEQLTTLNLATERGQGYSIRESREAVVELVYSNIDSLREYKESMTREEIIAELAEYADSVYTDANGDMFIVQRYYEDDYNNPTRKYPSYGYILDSSNNVCSFSYEYNTTYTGDWIETKVESSYNYYYLCELVGLQIRDDNNDYNESMYFTQSLFNEDSKYECLYVFYEYVEYSVNENDRDHDGNVDEIIRYYTSKPTKLEIRQDDGTVLFSYAIEDENVDDIYRYIYKLTSGTYLVLCLDNYDNDAKYIFFSIDKEGNSIKQVKSLYGMSVTPNPARSNETLTISLPESTSENSTREVTVSSMGGSIVMKKQISASEESVQVALNGVSGGVYNFTLTENGKAVENSRIIVK